MCWFEHRQPIMPVFSTAALRKCGPYKIYAAGLKTPDCVWSLANLELLNYMFTPAEFNLVAFRAVTTSMYGT